MAKKCTSCGTEISAEKNFSCFKCPSCGEVEIVRCDRCKMNVVKFVCDKCGFKVP